MKIHIRLAIVEGPYGGSHQFLRGLRGWLAERDLYRESPAKADVIVFDSCQEIGQVLRCRLSHPQKTFIHRVDGVATLYNRPDDPRDRLTILANRLVSDGTVFQSRWAKEQLCSLGLNPHDAWTVIANAPDPKVFHRQGKSAFSKDRKLRVVMSSWSKNWKKGFNAYQWLDSNLDFSKFELTFIGNSPVNFSHIRMLPPLAPAGLAQELKKHDVYLTASEKEACSNSLIEARHCGLPILALDDGGNPELTEKAGELFSTAQEIPSRLALMADRYDSYLKSPAPPSLDQVAQRYLDFFQKVASLPQKKKTRAAWLASNLPDLVRYLARKR